MDTEPTGTPPPARPAPTPAATVAVLRRRDETEVLLVQRGMTNLQGRPMSYAGAWVLPGGKIDSGETPVAAAVREVQEEVGLDLDPDGLVWLWVLPSESASGRRYETHYFAGFAADSAAPRPAPGELVDFQWIEVAKAYEASLAGTITIPRATTETLRRLRDMDLQ
jgi:8-oxo-dGTP pyrophosphatase MutT (NUDIX family)